jgi:inorganic pyrophosphatase
LQQVTRNPLKPGASYIIQIVRKNAARAAAATRPQAVSQGRHCQSGAKPAQYAPVGARLFLSLNARDARMRIDAIAIGYHPPEDVNVIVEVPVGGQPIKYEMDKEAGTLVVDRFLYTAMSYPGNYGFVPHTLSGDGDPIDVLICNTRQLLPGCVINVRPIGVLIMEDNAGQDEKVLAVPSERTTQRYDHVRDFDDLPEITLKQVEHFFEHYKDLEPGKWAKIGGWHDRSVAHQLIRDAIERARR